MKAFPNIASQQSMDLRDYFVAKALPAAIADKNTKKTAEDLNEDFGICAAIIAYQFADAMMQVREVGPV